MKNEVKETEVHPYKAFIPENVAAIIVGSFPGREVTHKILIEDDWFYGSKRNQFWKIISGVYQQDLLTKSSKQNLFKTHGIGLVDVFLKVKRKAGNNMDQNLEVVEYNDKAIREILQKHSSIKIYFTSRFVEKIFLKMFPEIKSSECLPSPSPRFAKMSFQEKIKIYKQKLP